MRGSKVGGDPETPPPKKKEFKSQIYNVKLLKISLGPPKQT